MKTRDNTLFNDRFWKSFELKFSKNFTAVEKTFEYTIMVIHEFLSLINDLEILNAEKE